MPVLESKKEEFRESYGGMSEHDGTITFAPIKKACDFPPGYYHFGEDMWGNTTAKKIPLKEEKVLSLNHSLQNLVVGEYKKFVSLADRYKKYSLAYKRAILLEGPPGCGKTSLIRQFIEMSVANGQYVTDLESIYDGHDVIQCFTDKPTLVIGEDIDKSFKHHDAEALLEVLDGNSSYTNVFYLFTTNFKERLPARLIARPGRVDRVVAVGFPSVEDKSAYLKGVFPDEDVISLMSIANMDETHSYADVKELATRMFVFGQEDLQAVAKELKLVKAMFPNGEEE
jgi:hypothetical protein